MIFVTIVFFVSFFHKGFTFHQDVCNGCQDILMMPMNLSNNAILNIQGVDYHFFIKGISKRETINLMQYLNLTEKSETL